jgi:hypothetical protein
MILNPIMTFLKMIRATFVRNCIHTQCTTSRFGQRFISSSIPVRRLKPFGSTEDAEKTNDFKHSYHASTKIASTKTTETFIPKSQVGGLHGFLRRVGISMSMGLGFTACTSASLVGFMGMEHLAGNFPVYIFGGFASALASAFVISTSKPNYANVNGETQAITKPLRAGAFAVLSGSLGVMIAPTMAMAYAMDPTILIAASSITGFTMAGLVHYSMRMPKGQMLKFGPALHIGLWGLIGNGFVGMFLGKLMMIL